jgi:ribonuclease E
VTEHMLEPDDPTATTSPDTPAATDAPAPRKRAPRKRAAAQPAAAEADPAASTAAESADSAAAGQPDAPAAAPRKRAGRKAAAAPAADGDTGEAPPARPARKRAPRKAAAKAAAEAPAEPITDPVAEPVTEATPAAVDIDAAPAPPAKKATRKRTARKVAAPAEDATPAEAAAAESDADAPGRPATAPAVLFQAPEATAAAGEVSVAEDAEDAEDAEVADGTADPDEVREVAAEQAARNNRRRRRRGRRGRGGAGRDAQDDGSDSDTDDTAGDAAADSSAGAAADTADDSADEAATGDDAAATDGSDEPGAEGDEAGGTRRRRRRRRSSGGGGGDTGRDSGDDEPNTVTHVRERRSKNGDDDGVRGVKGSTRLEAKRQRRRDGRETTRRRAPILTEAEFLARREAVDRVMAVRQNGDRTQIAVLEDDILVEHYVTRASATSYVGNVYLGRVQNVLPSMEAAFIDIGKGRNGVLYAGEVNWDAAGLEGKSRTIEQAMKSGDAVLVQVTKDPIGHKGARLTSQISLPGRFLVYVPGGGMTGISRRLPDTERHRLKAILKKIVPDEAGVIVRTAAEGASEEDLTHDVERLQAQWAAIQKKAGQTKAAPTLVHGEPDLAIRVVRDVFNEDFKQLVVQGDDVWATVSEYVGDVAPDLAERVSKHVGTTDLFTELRVDEQLMKALDRKVWLPSGGSLVIDRTEAMTVIDVNTGKFVGSGGNLEQTVTRNNLEAAEEIVRQLRLRDVGGIVVIDFIDMVLESNRELVLRRLTECLGRDRTKHQVAEVTSLGLVQMTRKRVGEGLLEAFSEPCEVCHGRGVIVHAEPVDISAPEQHEDKPKSRRKRGGKGAAAEPEPEVPAATAQQRQAATAAIAAIHRAAAGENGADDGDTSGLHELASGLVAAAMGAGQGAQQPADQPSDQPAPQPTDQPSQQPTDQPTQEPTAAAMDAVAGLETPAPAPETEDGEEARPAGRRRRRAASRPAGPPAVAS